ncbi:MAG TPA: glycosyltransferase family 39 protein [Gemmatimonadaceae bacterium]|nr:glycosyltransferase family 39 protein [Gemmatimonadaceae bacterium]
MSHAGAASPTVARVAGFTVVLIATLAIVSTYGVFSQTYDEPGHIAAGMEWWQHGRFTFEEQHPPLARAAVALGPYLAGHRLRGSPSMWVEGNAILYANGVEGYTKNLSLARAGMLPFFILACVAVWVWARRLGGDTAALGAIIAFAGSWPVLAHAGLATNDMAVTATLNASLLAYWCWLERPDLRRSVLLGVSLGAAVVSKLSTVLFFPVGAAGLTIAWLLSRRRRESATMRSISYPRGLGIAGWASILTIWAAYRFSFRWLGTMPLPAPELVAGIYQVIHHSAIGHASYLFGERSLTGWWYYFPVVLALKTPLPMLFLAAMGAAFPFIRRSRDEAWVVAAPAIAAIAMLLAVLPSSINAGVRYVLPLYPLLAVSAGIAVDHLWRGGELRSRVARAAVIALLAWQLFGAVRAHPDHLPAFNELGGRRPERLVDDSNVDWGQDLLRLGDELRQRRIGDVTVAYYGTADPTQHLGASYHRLAPSQAATGWIAVSERYLVGIVDGRIDDGYLWLRKFNQARRIGRSIRLIYVPRDTIDRH